LSGAAHSVILLGGLVVLLGSDCFGHCFVFIAIVL
jgi:hypothetical protein